MIFILFLTLIIKTFSFSIKTNYSGFYNFSQSVSFPLTIYVDYENEQNIEYYISYYDIDVSNNVTCDKNDEKSFICEFNKNGTYSFMVENNVTNKIILYKNIITIYNNEKFEAKSLMNKKNCFMLDRNINSSKLVYIKFDQLINKSLVKFNLTDNNNDPIEAIPFGINNTHTIIGVKNQTFYNNSKFDLIIYSQNSTLDKIENVLDFSNIQNISDDEYPYFLNIIKNKKEINSFFTNETYKLSDNYRINFTYINMSDKNPTDYFESVPQFLFPPSRMYNFYNNETDLTKYNNTLKFALDTYNITGQALFYYQYCGNEYKNYINFYFEENIEKKYGLSINNIIINKIFLVLIIFLFI